MPMNAPYIDPVAFSIFSLRIHWYGLMYLFGFLIALLLGKYRANRSKSEWNVDLCDDLLTYIALGVIVGGRVGYILFYDFGYYLQNPLEMVAIWKGGMSFHGGFLGVALALYIFARKYNKNTIDVLDFVAPFVAPSIFLGRIGNFINGELWGRVTDVPWGMVFLSAGSLPRHPSQLYEALGEGLLTFLVVWIVSMRPQRRGFVGAIFGLCYALSRFTVEFVREPDAQLGFIAFGWLTMGMLLTALFAFAAIGLLFYSRTQPITSWKE